MGRKEDLNRRIDVLAIGLFGLAVGALTVGLAQMGVISEVDKIGVLAIALVFGGIVQLLAGITDIRYNEQLGGTALTMYGFFWLTVSTVKLVSGSTSLNFDSTLYIPIELIYLVFSAAMIYLTAYRSVALSLLHLIITLTFFAGVMAKLNMIPETLVGVGHVCIGLLAFYHAIGSLSLAFTGKAIVPLGPPLFSREPADVLRHHLGLDRVEEAEVSASIPSR